MLMSARYILLVLSEHLMFPFSPQSIFRFIFSLRQKRVNAGKSDPCGAVHITIGDGGNREGLAHKYGITIFPLFTFIDFTAVMIQLLQLLFTTIHKILF